MPVPVNISVGVTGIANYLLVVVRKVSDPSQEATRQSFGPAPSAINMTFELDPTTYYFDFRDSADGVALGTLVATYTVDAASNAIVSEKRYYTCDGAGTYDPAPNTLEITDPYFLNKTVSSVFREAFRFLEPDTEWEQTDDTITILSGSTFEPNEKIMIEIVYKSQIATQNETSLFSGVSLLTASTTLDATYYNKRVKLTGATSVLVITLPTIASMPDGKFFYFNSFGGLQKQTKFICQDADKILYDGLDLPVNELGELWIGKGEHLWIEKRGTFFEVLDAHKGISMVGEKFSATYKSHPNSVIEDGSLYDGDENPRIWYWLQNILPITHKVTDDAVTGGGYVHPAGKEGQFVVHSTLKKFRVPNTQNLFERGLADFDTYGGDVANRPIDYPGGYQEDTMKQTAVSVVMGRTKRGTGSDPNDAAKAEGGAQFGSNWNLNFNIPGAAEVRVKNNGVIFCRRF